MFMHRRRWIMAAASSARPATGERLGVVEKIGYGLGDTASNFFFQTFNIFLLYYYTDVFGISAIAAGWVFLLARALDAVADPLMGVIADRTRSRHGKFRPYLLWASIPYGFLGYLMFSNPSLGATGKVIFAGATYTLMMLAYTAVNIPYSALMGVMSPSSQERTSLSAYRFMCAFTGGLIIASTVAPLKNFLGGGDEARGFMWTIILFAIASVLLFWFTFFSTRERVVPLDDKDASLRKDLGFLVRNRAWVVLFFAAIFTLTNVAVRNSVIIYYLKYYVRDTGAKVFLWFDHTSLFMTSGMLALILGVACTQFVSKRWDKRTLMIVLSTLNALAMASFFFLGPDQLGLMYAINIVGTFIVGPTPALVWAMYADTADYGEWRFRRRTTGLVFSAALFAQKLGLAIGSALAGWFLAYYGFVPNAVQDERALLGIKLMFCIAPAAFAMLNVVALYLYPLDRDTVSKVERELTERRALAASESPTAS